MCGLAGIWGRERGSGVPDAWRHEVERMLEVLRHRGPDDEQVVVAGSAVVGACRLAILDPEHGAQPMTTSDGEFTLALNGAVVNHVELREELETRGSRLRTRCDTEVLLELLAREGSGGLAKVNGMFAGVLASSSDGSVLLFRDPCGIKPLYWLDEGDRVLWASEPKALLEVARERPRPCRAALLEYLSFQMPLGDGTFFEGVRRLPGGTTLRLVPGQAAVQQPLPEFADVPDVPGDVDGAASVLRELLQDAVRIHLRSDVPLGTHLSGGVDSSLVAAHASRLLDGPVHVFTGAFDVPGFDERPHARAVAAELGVVSHEVVLGPGDLADALPAAVRAMDEPAAGPGLLPQWFVAKLASEHVKVVLGGQGGDETFSGYVRHLVLRLEMALSDAIREGDTRGLRALAPHLASLDGYGPLLRRHFGGGLFEPIAERTFRLLHRGEGLASVLSGDLASSLADYPARERFLDAFGDGSEVGDAVRFDRRVFLPALLQVEDRTSMAWSVESRVPLLDRRILGFVDRCPDEVLFGDGELKYLLRRAATPDLPEAARRRRDKMGFPVPLAVWARGPLGEFLRDLLLDKVARERGFFDPAGVERLLAGETVAARHLWALVNVELWHRTFAP